LLELKRIYHSTVRRRISDTGRDIVEILTEKSKCSNRERNAFTLIHQIPYIVDIDSEPVLGFIWDVKEKRWVYNPHKHYAFTQELLNADEIIVKIPLDDSIKFSRQPYINDLRNPKFVIALEPKLMNVFKYVANLPPPKFIELQKKKKKVK